MFLDALLLVSDAQALTATGVSTNTIDLGAPTVKRRIGAGEPLCFLVTVDVAADVASGDETYEFQAVSDDLANLSSTTLMTSRTIPRASLVAGSQWIIDVPPNAPIEQYVGMRYVLGGTTPSITVTAALMTRSMAQEVLTAYSKNYVV